MPHRLDIGGLEVVAPGAGLRLNRSQWALLDMAMVADSDGDPVGARALLDRLENDLGVTRHDRIVASGGEVVGEFVDLNIARGKPDVLKAKRAELRRIRGLIAPPPAPVTKNNTTDLTEAEAARTLAAQAQARSLKAWKDGDRALARRLHGEASTHLARSRALSDRAEADRNKRTNQADIDRAMSERRAIAEGRGEKLVEEQTTAFVTVKSGLIPVERQQVARRIRNTSRDGLEALRTQAKLSKKKGEGINQAQYAAGLRYRELFEGAQADLRSGMSGEGGGGFGGSRCPTSDRQLWVRDQLVKSEKRVQRETGETSLHVLREVAGKGACLSHLSASGSRQAYLKKALTRALDVVARSLGIH